MQQAVDGVGHQAGQHEVIHHRIQVVGRVGIRRVVGIQSADDDGRRVGGGGEGDGVGFPVRPVVGPGEAVGEGIGLVSGSGEESHLGRHGADQHVGAVLAAAAGVVDGVDLAGGEGALIDAELIQAAREGGSRGRAAEGPAQDVLVLPGPAGICAESNPCLAGGIHGRCHRRHRNIGKEPLRHPARPSCLAPSKVIRTLVHGSIFQIDA